MSTETWKAEFSPPLKKRATRLEMVDWCIRKWVGLRKKNLDKHSVPEPYALMISDGDIWINTAEDPLCERYQKQYECPRCPVFMASKTNPCDDTDHESAWWKWEHNDNPEPMIRALRKAKKMLER
jgi:hypothetical protein